MSISHILGTAAANVSHFLGTVKANVSEILGATAGFGGGGGGGDITWEAASTAVYSTTTTIAVDYPAGIEAGELLVMFVGQKPSPANGGSVPTISGWTLIDDIQEAGGYGATLGGDTGNVNQFAYYQEATGSESGSVSVTLTDANIAWGHIHRLSKSGGTWDVAGAAGVDESAGSVSVTFDGDPGVQEGDYVLCAFTYPANTATGSQFDADGAFSQSGVTFGAVSEVEEPNSSLGNDIGAGIWRAAVTAGPSGGAPTFTVTAAGTTTNVRGGAIFVRVRASA